MTLNSAQSMPSLPMRSSRKPRVILVLLIAMCGLFVYSYTSRLVEKSQVEAEIVAMRARIAEAEAEQLKLLAERNGLNQPDFIDRIAREKFDRAKPGDKLLVIIDEPAIAPSGDNAISATATNEAVDFREFPVWQQWVYFFTSDGFTRSMK